jgi:hypothetical protein
MRQWLGALGMAVGLALAGIGCGADPIHSCQLFCDRQAAACTTEPDGTLASCKGGCASNLDRCSNGGDIAKCIDACNQSDCTMLTSCYALCPACKP